MFLIYPKTIDPVISFVRFQILLTAFLVKIVAFAVDDNYKGHIFYVKLTQCFLPKVLIGNEFCFLMHFARRAPAPPIGSEINAVIFFHGLYYFRKTGALFRSFLGAYGHHGRCIRIHTAAGGRTCGSDDLAWFCRGRSYVINGCVCRIKRDFLSFASASHILLCPGITGCIDSSCQIYLYLRHGVFLPVLLLKAVNMFFP